MAENVDAFLKDMTDDDRHTELYRSMIFPTTSSERQRDVYDSIVTAEYTCTNQTCDMRDAIDAVSKSARLKVGWKTESVCSMIAKDIAEHQDDYLPWAVDGYFINRSGRKLVYLKRQVDVKERGAGLSGVIEYTDLSKDAAAQFEAKKIQMFIHMAKQMPDSHGSCNIL